MSEIKVMLGCPFTRSEMITFMLEYPDYFEKEEIDDIIKDEILIESFSETSKY